MWVNPRWWPLKALRWRLLRSVLLSINKRPHCRIASSSSQGKLPLILKQTLTKRTTPCKWIAKKSRIWASKQHIRHRHCLPQVQQQIPRLTLQLSILSINLTSAMQPTQMSFPSLKRRIQKIWDSLFTLKTQEECMLPTRTLRPSRESLILWSLTSDRRPCPSLCAPRNKYSKIRLRPSMLKDAAATLCLESSKTKSRHLKKTLLTKLSYQKTFKFDVKACPSGQVKAKCCFASNFWRIKLSLPWNLTETSKSTLNVSSNIDSANIVKIWKDLFFLDGRHSIGNGR
jgi:hypothetical protein